MVFDKKNMVILEHSNEALILLVRKCAPDQPSYVPSLNVSRWMKVTLSMTSGSVGWSPFVLESLRIEVGETLP